MFSPLSTIKKFHVQEQCLQGFFYEKLKLFIFFFQEDSSRKFLVLFYLIFLFFDCKYRLHLLLFSLIVMTFPACTCELVHIQDSFEFLWLVSGLCVQVWFKRYLHAATRVPMFSPFSLFVFSFHYLHYHTFMFFNSLTTFPQIWKQAMKSQY